MFSEKKKPYDQYVLRNLKQKVLRAVVTGDFSKCLILEKKKESGPTARVRDTQKTRLYLALPACRVSSECRAMRVFRVVSVFFAGIA